MSGNEPGSGWNLPPGLHEADPRAPWTAPEPWEGRSCWECRRCLFCDLLDGRSVRVCTADPYEIVQVDELAPACESFED